jgi:hypothetical protein
MAAHFMRTEHRRVRWRRAIAKRVALLLMIYVVVAGPVFWTSWRAGLALDWKDAMAPAAAIAVMSISLWILFLLRSHSTVMRSPRRIAIRSSRSRRLPRWLKVSAAPVRMLGPHGSTILRLPVASMEWDKVQAAFLAGDRMRLVTASESLLITMSGHDLQQWREFYDAVRESLRPHLPIPPEISRIEHRRMNRRILKGWRKAADLIFVVLLVCTVLGVALAASLANRWLPGVIGFAAPILLLAAIIGAAFVFERRRSRQDRQLWHVDCCRACGYELTGLGVAETSSALRRTASDGSVTVTCPECGAQGHRARGRVKGP